jgi:hypothetical protein
MGVRRTELSLSLCLPQGLFVPLQHLQAVAGPMCRQLRHERSNPAIVVWGLGAACCAPWCMSSIGYVLDMHASRVPAIDAAREWGRGLRDTKPCGNVGKSGPSWGVRRSELSLSLCLPQGLSVPLQRFQAVAYHAQQQLRHEGRTPLCPRSGALGRHRPPHAACPVSERSLM